MKGALNEKTLGAIEAPAKKLDCEPTNQNVGNVPPVPSMA
jgi:hypothetical protein